MINYKCFKKKYRDNIKRAFLGTHSVVVYDTITNDYYAGDERMELTYINYLLEDAYRHLVNEKRREKLKIKLNTMYGVMKK